MPSLALCMSSSAHRLKLTGCYSFSEDRAALLKASALLRSAAGNFYLNEWVFVFHLALLLLMHSCSKCTGAVVGQRTSSLVHWEVLLTLTQNPSEAQEGLAQTTRQEDLTLSPVSSTQGRSRRTLSSQSSCLDFYWPSTDVVFHSPEQFLYPSNE